MHQHQVDERKVGEREAEKAEEPAQLEGRKVTVKQQNLATLFNGSIHIRHYCMVRHCLQSP
jgi:hypothetical protein